jgi:RES domain
VTPHDIDANFPAITFHPERILFRVHRTINDPIHFASDPYGRFNLLDTPGRGTCYMAPSPLGAYVETLGRIGAPTGEDIEERSLSELALTRPLVLADLTDRQVLGRYGITGDISTGNDNRPSQGLAAALYELGRDGVYYAARHDPAFRERSVAVFGGPDDDKLFIVNTYAIPDELVAEGARQFGLRV